MKRGTFLRRMASAVVGVGLLGEELLAKAPSLELADPTDFLEPGSIVCWVDGEPAVRVTDAELRRMLNGEVEVESLALIVE